LADFANEPTFQEAIRFKLTHYAIQSETFTCSASTLSDDSKMIHIPDVLLPDGTRIWLDMAYSESDSPNENVYFYVSKYGVISK
jgi:hypothetical protein